MASDVERSTLSAVPAAQVSCPAQRPALVPVRVQLELPLEVLCRLLRQGSIVASEWRCLDPASHRAVCWAVKASTVD